MGYSRDQLLLCEGATIPDLIGEDCKLLFVGINPGLQTAMTGIHFAHPSNRFWPALKKAGLIDWVPNVSPVAPAVGINPGLWTAATQTHSCHPSNRFFPSLVKAGLVDWTIDTGVGMSDDQRDDFTRRGMGITNLVSRATVRASELSTGELRQGGERLGVLLEDLRPDVVAVAGITAYRTAFSSPTAKLGQQATDLSTSAVWAVPNPSGLNAHETVDSLANWYRSVATAAGLT